MPNVVVYVPARAWKALEERGLDPAKTIREFAKKGFDIGVLSERDGGHGAEVQNPVTDGRAVGRQVPTPIAPITRSESTPKKRMHPCKHHLPPSKHCPYGCDG